MASSLLVALFSTGLERLVTCDAEGYLGKGSGTSLESIKDGFFKGEPAMGVAGRLVPTGRANSLGI